MGVKIANSSRIIGRIRIGHSSLIGQGAVVRSQGDSVTIGNGSMVLENSVVIGTEQNPVEIGNYTVFGHKCNIIGAKVGRKCEIGNGVILLPGSSVGDRCIFGEGTIIPPNTNIPSDTVVLGRPGRKLRSLTKEDFQNIENMRTGLEYNQSQENIINGEDTMGLIYAHKDQYPNIGENVQLYDTAEISGQVTIGSGSIIGSGVKIIGDSHGSVSLGKNVEILENSVLHLLPGNNLCIGDNVVIGPNTIIHGCTIGDNSIVEAGAIICDQALIGPNSYIRAGSLVAQRSQVVENSIVEGYPAKKVAESSGDLEKPDWALSKR